MICRNPAEDETPGTALPAASGAVSSPKAGFQAYQGWCEILTGIFPTHSYQREQHNMRESRESVALIFETSFQQMAFQAADSPGFPSGGMSQADSDFTTEMLRNLGGVKRVRSWGQQSSFLSPIHTGDLILALHSLFHKTEYTIYPVSTKLGSHDSSLTFAKLLSQSASHFPETR